MLSLRFLRFFRYLNFATLREVIKGAAQQRLAGLSAEMAYNAMLAICPAILAFLVAIGLFESLQSTIFLLARQVAKFAPDDVRSLIRGLILELSTSRNRRLFSLSFIASLWAFSGAMSAAMAALDQIHQLPISQVRPFWRAKLVSLGLSIGTILLLINASALVFISDLIVQLVASQSQILESGMLAAWRLFTWPIALAIVAIAFGFIYRYGPSRWPRGTPIMPGAVLAAVSWAIISGLFRLYVSHFGNYNRTYGAVGAVIVLLLWLYLSSLVMLIGAQLNVTVGKAMSRSE